VATTQQVIRMVTGRFFLMLMTFIFLFTVYPLLVARIKTGFIFDLMTGLILVAGVSAVSSKRSRRWISLALVVPAMILTGLDYAYVNPALRQWEQILLLLFFICAAAWILEYIFLQREVTSEVISGAICTYFMMGMFWAYLYALLELLSPGAFQGPLNPDRQSGDFFYFSFTTLSTLGYGDVTPASQLARGLAMLEAISGQMYLAIIIARLVGIHAAQSTQVTQETPEKTSREDQ